MEHAGPSAVFVVLLGGLGCLLLVVSFLLFRTISAAPDFTRALRWGSRIALVFAALLLAWFALELGARILIPGGYLKASPHRGSEPDAIVEQLPDGRAYWEYRGHWDFDDDGLRNVPDAGADAWRLGILGDSVTYGVSVPGEKRFVHLLAEAIAARCNPVQLIDAATPAYAFHQERIAFERKVLPRKPDLVLVGAYTNDMNQFTVVGSTAYDIRIDLNDGFPAFSFLPLPDAINVLLLEHSVFYQWVTLRGQAVLDKYSGRARAQLDLAVDELEAIRDGCEQASCHVVLVLFPDLKEPLSEPESRHAKRFYDSLREWANKHGVATVEVRELLANEDVEAIRLDECCHYNEAGHALVADKLLGELERLKLLPAACL